jgi:hypothetical protein
MPLTNREDVEVDSYSPQPRNIRSSYSDTDLKTPRTRSKYFINSFLFFLLFNCIK